MNAAAKGERCPDNRATSRRSRTTSPRSGSSRHRPAFRERAVVGDPGVYDEAATAGPRVLGPAGRRPRLVPPVGHGARPGTCPSPAGSTAARSTCRTTASTGTWPPARGDKVAFHWEGEPGDTRTISYADLLVEVCRFANVLRGLGRGPGRPGGRLHADGARAGRGHAGLHPDRRRPFGGVRRLLLGRPTGPHPGRRGQGGGDRRRRLAPGPGRRAQGQRRRRRVRDAVRRPRGRGASGPATRRSGGAAP